jgi:hypothetical protein
MPFIVSQTEINGRKLPSGPRFKALTESSAASGSL